MPQLLFDAKWVVGRPGQAREGRPQHERGDPLGIRGGEQQRHRPSLRHAHKCSRLAACCVHHRPHIVHALFQCRQRGASVGETHAALVEGDQARKPRHPPIDRRGRRRLPAQLHVRERSGDAYEVRPLASHPVGDAEIAALGTAVSPGSTCWWAPPYVAVSVIVVHALRSQWLTLAIPAKRGP